MTTDAYVATMTRLFEQRRFREVVELSYTTEDDLGGTFTLMQLETLAACVTMSINMLRLDEIEAEQAAGAEASRRVAG